MIPSIFTLSGIALAILGLLQFIFIPDISFLSPAGWDPHFYRTVSTFLDPNFLGIFLVLSMMSFTLQPKPIIGEKVNFLFFLVLYLALMTTFSRSAYLMFLATFLSLALLKKSLKMIIVTISLSLGLILALTVYQITIAQPHNINRQQSAEYRLGSWEMGINLFKSAPVFGIGYNSYKYALRQYQLAPETIFQGHGGSSNDSSLLFVAATTGVVGLAAYLTFLGIIIFAAFKNYLNGNQNAGIACLSGLTGLTACSFFVNALFYPWSLVWLMSTASQLKETRMKLLQRFISLNRKVCDKLEGFLPQAHPDITNLYDEVVARYMNAKSDQAIIDIGGGRYTSFAKYKNPKLKAMITAVDKDISEISKNKEVDEIIVADVSQTLPFGENTIDMIVSRYVLEHLDNLEKFIGNSKSVLKEGGYSIHLFAGKFAPFATLNRLLPNKLSRRVLQLFLPPSHDKHGFKTYYNCDYTKALELFEKYNFQIEKVYVSYYQSRYFGFFVPFFLLSALYELIILLLNLRRLSSYVLIIAKKRG